MTEHVLQPEAQVFADAAAKPPFIPELGVADARKVLDDVQAAPVDLLDIDEEWVTVQAELGEVQVRIVRSAGVSGPLPVVLFTHGGGWVLGSASTHDRLVRELAVGANAAVAFVEYTRSPEARHPVAIEQAYATARWLIESGAEHDLDATRMAIAGDSVGGNMAAVLAILAKRRGDVRFIHQSLYYPVTDAGMATTSYREFAEGFHLRADAMAWFWDCYLPDPAARTDVTASPLRAPLEELAGLPEAFVIVDENDVLRDEGEAYGRRLIEAGVRTTLLRYDATIHDFMMLNPLRPSAATSAAVAQAAAALRDAFARYQP
ncbi:alpha/beta hydrolase [Intrasporangium mesophilum]